jgi:ABC-type molybdate transport system substrate-binding protein
MSRRHQQHDLPGRDDAAGENAEQSCDPEGIDESVHGASSIENHQVVIGSLIRTGLHQFVEPVAADQTVVWMQKHAKTTPVGIAADRFDAVVGYPQNVAGIVVSGAAGGSALH